MSGRPYDFEWAVRSSTSLGKTDSKSLSVVGMVLVMRRAASLVEVWGLLEGSEEVV